MRAVCCRALAFLLFSSVAHGQWAEQVVQLRPGWNAVYLSVEPADKRVESHFGSAAIRSIHTQEPALVAENPCDPTVVGCVSNSEPAWLTWRPPSHTASFANQLTSLRAGRVYLINASQDAQVSILGNPLPGSVQWRTGWNLAGGFVSQTDQPTFAEYFRNSPAHAGTTVFGLDTLATWHPIDMNGSMMPGVGYWIRASQGTSYSGPIEIDEFTLRGVDFGRRLEEHAINMRVTQGQSETALLTYRPSDSAPQGVPGVAGDVPLLVKEFKTEGDTPGWTWSSLSGAYEVALGPGLRSTRIAIDRSTELPQALVNPDGTGQAYQGLIEVSDGRGFSRLVSVAGQMSGNAGLWVGTVTVESVAWVHAGLMGELDETSPRPTASPFSFRVLIHVDGTGAAKLLSEVMLLWDDQIDDHVLATPATPAAELARLKPTGLQDGQSFTRRISTAGYFVDEPLSAAPEGMFGSALQFELTLQADHKLNPFKHAFHPDHDGDQAGELYVITRAITLTFSQLENGSWNGTYTESIEGLNKQTTPVPVNVSGSFELSKVSEISSLN